MKQHEQWTSKIGFILAAAGSAIGLGNMEVSVYGGHKWWRNILLIVYSLHTHYCYANVIG